VILWRVSNYATLDGAGGLYPSGRWHSKGRSVLYCTLNPATALLESLVHLEIDAEDRPTRFQVLRITGPDTLSRERIDPNALPEGWSGNLLLTQSLGDQWLTEKRSLLLEVPSVLAPETWNAIVNPLHHEMDQLRVAALYEHPFDTRFFP
jgi:RES domain-containing protein